MKNDSESSAPTSAKTSKTAQTPPKHESEAQFVARQGAAARDAIGETARQIGRELAAAANPVGWTREYPWVGVGVAVGLGVAVAMMITPKKDQSVADKLEELKDLFSRHADETADRLKTKSAPPAAPKESIFSKLIGPISQVAKTAASLAISASFKGKDAAAEAAAESNGNGDGSTD